jgi:hypothetical protein
MSKVRRVIGGMKDGGEDWMKYGVNCILGIGFELGVVLVLEGHLSRRYHIQERVATRLSLDA